MFSALPRPGSSGGHIYVSPDSDLTKLPFDGLLSDSDKALVQLWDVSYLPSGRQLVEKRSGWSHRSGTTVFADQAVAKRGVTSPDSKVQRGTMLAKNMLPCP